MKFNHVDINKFAAFHTTYTDANIFTRFDWNERVDDAIDCLANKTGLFVYDDDKLIGGFTLAENKISYPFMVPPYRTKKEFWGVVLSYAGHVNGPTEIFLNEIPETDVHILKQLSNVKLRHTKQRMLRPTERYTPMLNDDFYFDILTEKDKPEIIKVIFEAHSDGYTAMVEKPDIDEIKHAVERRYDSFGKTDTLFMGNLVKRKTSHEIAGVCIAGIYPSSKTYSTSNFATIHQVSVIPKYRRNGIAKAMILKSINDASSVSPVITLGVMIGNPAETLYEEIGFAPGPCYSELIYVP